MYMLGVDTLECDAQHDEGRLNVSTARPSGITIASNMNSFQLRQEPEDFTPLLKQVLVHIARLPLDNEFPSDRRLNIRVIAVKYVRNCIAFAARA
jgi:hypothetical protein